MHDAGVHTVDSNNTYYILAEADDAGLELDQVCFFSKFRKVQQ